MLIYKSVSDLNITIVLPRNMNFMGRATFVGSNFFIVVLPMKFMFPDFNMVTLRSKKLLYIYTPQWDLSDNSYEMFGHEKDNSFMK